MQSQPTARVLVVDDDEAVQVSLALLAQAGAGIDLVPQDMNFSLQTDGAEGLALLQALRERHPHLPVLLMTAWGSITLAVAGIKAGAANFFSKPWDSA